MIYFLVIFGLFILLLYFAAKNKQQATFVARNHFEIKVYGENPVEVLLNMGKRAYYDVEKDEVISTEGLSEEDREKKLRGKMNFFSWWLWERWGFRWVSIVFPERRLLKIKIKRKRIKEEKDDEGNSIFVIFDEDDIETVSIRVEFERPVAVIGAEDKGRLAHDLVLNATFIVTKPVLWATTWHVNFDLLMDAIRGAVIDLVRDKSFEDILAMGKGRGSKFSQEIITAVGGNTKEKFGVLPTDVWVVEFRPDRQASNALKAGRILKLQADAELEQAKVNKEAAFQRAQGEAAPVLELGAAYELVGSVAPLVNAERVAANMKDLKGTLVNGTVVPTLPIGGSPAPVPPPPPTPTPPGSSGP